MNFTNPLEPLDIIFNPEKHAVYIPSERIIADKKVYREGVDFYKRKLERGEDLGTLRVIKHPQMYLYAVLDGHHRYWAQRECGVKKIKCAPLEDSVGLLFFFTKEGLLQPLPLFTKYFRVPFKRMENYLNDFFNNPEKLMD